MAGAIVLTTIAFSIWNIGTRSPATVLRELRAAGTDRKTLIAGIARAVIGAIFLAAEIVLLLPAVANPAADFAPTEFFVFLVGLALEHVIGADIRALSESRRTSP